MASADARYKQGSRLVRTVEIHLPSPSIFAAASRSAISYFNFSSCRPTLCTHEHANCPVSVSSVREGPTVSMRRQSRTFRTPSRVLGDFDHPQSPTIDVHQFPQGLENTRPKRPSFIHS